MHAMVHDNSLCCFAVFLVAHTAAQPILQSFALQSWPIRCLCLMLCFALLACLLENAATRPLS